MHYQFQISTAAEISELALAYLQELPFESFEETEDGWNAYIAAATLPDTFEDSLKQIQQKCPFTYQKVAIPDQNWNAIWESNFTPIIIDDFCGIRADFHAPITSVTHEIVINPKMAFGTGHHETTHMMIQQMSGLSFLNKKVLDYGTGTGILAILAARLGAKTIIGVEIEEPAVVNTLENLASNNTPDIQIIHGTLENISDKAYDIILANINRNVILNSLPTLYDKLNQDGLLLVSGFIKADFDLLVQKADQEGFKMVSHQQRNNWICIAFSKK